VPDLPPLPTFVIIGAQKSATRWLRHNLGEHPEVYTAPGEPTFFNHPERYRVLGTEWYREKFAGAAGERVVGEATPGYMMWRHRPAEVARRIDETLPEVRLIAVLRDPVERAASALVHHIKEERIPPHARLIDVVGQQPPEEDWLGLVAGGWYAASLEPYLERFGDRLLVVLHDDVVRDPHEVYRRALAHVGASADFAPPTLEDTWRSNRTEPFERASGITPEERAELFEHFRDDVARLEQMLDLDLSSWRPAARPAA
jgi:Sulfotransferase domain